MGCSNFSGVSNPTMGNKGKSSFKNPSSKGLTGMASGSNAMNGATNHVMARNANQGKAGGPKFKGAAGNPVNTGR